MSFHLNCRAVMLTALLLSGSASQATETSTETISGALLQAHRGKVVLLDFWASWCQPCRKSFPWMNQLQKKYGKEGLLVVAVNVDHEKQLAAEFLKATPAEFEIAYDADGKLATQFNVSAMPTSFLVDRHGQIVKQHAGFREAQLNAREQEIINLLKEASP